MGSGLASTPEPDSSAPVAFEPIDRFMGWLGEVLAATIVDAVEFEVEG